MTASHPGHDNPQLTLTEAHPCNREVCDVCGKPIDPGIERWELTTGRTPRTERHAVAHSTVSAETDGEGPCYDQIRRAWLALAADSDAGLLAAGGSFGSWTLHGDPLHCGDPVQILLGGGTWVDGTYQLLDGARGPTPAVAVNLGGLNRPTGLLTIPAGALLRPQPPRRH